ncbi:hypothetical protein BCR43DRAFT_498279 [Syncephalastrum racemosum]|uniref:Yeast cell wall synthesis Kre9/Knh1-like N-terminal domain-containing protein n=1 Tax=Syncephalastrum racemosum TaxID=13706 RepID=A0A1X2H0V4_SYNRA|nr:hypothetical protein BCR43DRAFT_498279 [Syncephalastrum racemosum]
MKFTLLASAALVAAVSAQQNAPPVSITAPLQGTTYKAGSKAIISWVNAQVPTISKITLAHGPPTALQPLFDIATNVDAKSGTYQWDVPLDCENGQDYAFEIGQSPDLAFTGVFSIEGCTGGGFASASKSAGGAAPAGGSAAPSAGKASSAPAAGGSSAAAGPSSNAAATPAGASGSASASSAGQSASASHTSDATHLVSGKAVAALAIAAAAASQFF